MFNIGWEHFRRSKTQIIRSTKDELATVERQIEQLLEQNKRILQESLSKKAEPVKPFHETFRTAAKSLPFSLPEGFSGGKSGMVGPAGLEPARPTDNRF